MLKAENYNIINRNKCLVFYSWQSDRKACKNFISSVIKQLSKDMDEVVPIEVDRDTWNVPGSPDIADTIFEKIERSDLFLADITLINDSESKYRRTPNPNVLIELGYAIKTLGWDHIILLYCSDYGDVEDLPFDINHRRVCKFSLNKKHVGEEKLSEASVSKKATVRNIIDTIKLLKENDNLFGGQRIKIPKFELFFCGYEPYLLNIDLVLKNVSSIYISELSIQNLYAISDGENDRRDLLIYPSLDKKSFGVGETTKIYLHNEKLGAGPGYNNSVWTNYTLIMQFSCEDESGNKYYYEAEKHIRDIESINKAEQWIINYIG